LRAALERKYFYCIGHVYDGCNFCFLKKQNFLRRFFLLEKLSKTISFLTTLTIWPFKISRKLLFIKTFYLEWQEITDNHEKCFKAFFAQVMKETKFAWKAPRGKTGTCEVAKTCCKIIQNISRKYCLNYLITFTIFIFILTRSSL
jgi:hypothetical protein